MSLNNIKKYIGNTSQLWGVEEYTLSKGKGKGMTILEVRNGMGLRLCFSADRAMDISRAELNGTNMGDILPLAVMLPQVFMIVSEMAF